MDQDPGWPLSGRMLVLSLLPRSSIGRAARDESRPQLLVLRQLFMSFVMAFGWISVVVVILGDVAEGDPNEGLSLALVVGVGLMSLLLGALVKSRLDGSSERTLAASYRTRFSWRLAMAEVAALTSFAIGIAIGPIWVYWIGLASAAVGFVRLAPTTRHIEADQRRLAAEGSHRSLLAALLEPQVA